DIEPVGLLRLCDEDGPLGLRDLQVVPERQGQGIGTWAVRQTQALALERGSVCVQLRVYEENPAARLYRRLGFEIRYVANGVIHMAWTLPLYRSSAAAGTLEPRGTRYHGPPCATHTPMTAWQHLVRDVPDFPKP